MMKYLFPLLFIGFSATAQTRPEDIVDYKMQTVKQVNTENLPPYTYLLPAPYGKAALQFQSAQPGKNEEIISVELVYTRYRRSDAFNQKKLNLQRLQQLKNRVPVAFSSGGVEWIITEQTGAEDYAEGKTYFHGFILKTRPANLSKTERETEITALMKDLEERKKGSTVTDSKFKERTTPTPYDADPVRYYDKGPEFGKDRCELPEDAAAHITYPEEALKRKISGRVEAQITVNRAGGVQDIRITNGLGFGCDEAVKNYLKSMPRWTPAKSKAGNVNAYVTLSFWFISNGIFPPEAESSCELILIVPEGYSPEKYNTERSTVVSDVFTRNPQWKNLSVVCDVTGSMGPYLSDLMEWFRSNQSRIKYFTFFNDGDTQPDARKQVGSTGGIYLVPSSNSDVVEKEMLRAMRNGFGGDLPENDMEALLEAEKIFPFAERLIWIADNYAFPRDARLAAQVTKPVSVILCSSQGGLNTDLLTLARQLKATVHTPYSDITDLHKIEEGGKIEVDDRSYIFSQGKFRRVF